MTTVLGGEFCDRVPCGTKYSQLKTYTKYDDEPPAVFTGKFLFFGDFEPIQRNTVRLAMDDHRAFDFLSVNIHLDGQSGQDVTKESCSFNIKGSNSARVQYSGDFRVQYSGDIENPGSSGGSSRYSCSFSQTLGTTTFTQFKNVQWVDFSAGHVKPHLKDFTFRPSTKRTTLAPTTTTTYRKGTVLVLRAATTHTHTHTHTH